MSSTNTHSFNLTPSIALYAYISAFKMTKKEFSDELGISLYKLDKLLRGGRLSENVIESLSRCTKTEPEYWINLQMRYLLKEFLIKRRNISKPMILPIISRRVCPVKVEYPVGHFLNIYFLKPLGLPIKALVEHLKMSHFKIRALVYNQIQINQSIAYELAKTFNNTPYYWIELQTRFEIFKALKEKRKLKNIVTQDLNKFLSSAELFSLQKSCHHPGTVLRQKLNQYNISLSDWSKIFWISKNHLTKIIAGEQEISVELALKICSIFQTPITYWLSLQRDYYSPEGPNEQRLFNEHELRREFFSLNHVTKYLAEMGWELNYFANYINIKKSKLQDIFDNKMKPDFEISVRLGQALCVDPYQFLLLK
jgi:addiction module HigA family antidote